MLVIKYFRWYLIAYALWRENINFAIGVYKSIKYNTYFPIYENFRQLNNVHFICWIICPTYKIEDLFPTKECFCVSRFAYEWMNLRIIFANTWHQKQLYSLEIESYFITRFYHYGISFYNMTVPCIWKIKRQNSAHVFNI